MTTAGGRLRPGDVVAVVGLGRMGQEMASRLQQAGYLVQGFDVDEDARQSLERAGGSAAASLQEVARGAQAVLLMLPTSAVVTSVLQEQGLLQAMGPDALLVDMGSSQPEVTRRLADVAEQHGVRMLDAPVSGGVKGARAGTLTIMAGGPAAWVEELTDLLAVLGKQTVHVGPVGAGHAVKALNNLLSASHLLASSEALAVGRRFGLDPQTMLDAINGSSGKSWSTEMKLPAYVLPETFSSGFSLALLVKDTRIAVELSRSTGVPADHAEATLELWERAMAELPEDADHTEIARWVATRGAAPVVADR